MSSEPCPLTGAQSAVCRLVHRGPRPQAVLKPLRLELQVYVDKTRSKQKHRMEASCLELALEGERLCKAGDFKGGTAFFEAGRPGRHGRPEDPQRHLQPAGQCLLLPQGVWKSPGIPQARSYIGKVGVEL
ncbi:hypothetical protein fugu_019389 [Takifugu bimaculatus]|uniref:Uncharacterized protein n=1 Tax=Takifugu bimaculatus TaxID=433685 RepID=A0A4Z2BKT8_9TELE|nr:hypothetical protein fugu_019389 [Takifugu bimaculatus]